MKILRGRHAVRLLFLAVGAALAVILWGALFLIAPIWHWEKPAAAYRPYVADSAVLESPERELLNVNTATEEDLTALPGIGPVKARAIVEYREQNGPFADLQELDKVYGISAQMVEGWRGLATAGAPED